MANNSFNVSSGSIVHENLSLGSGFAQNHVNGQGRIIPQGLAPTIGVQPSNVFVPQRGPGQIALGRRLSGVRRTQISPLIRARIHTIVEYLPAEQSQIEALPLHPASGYTVTDIPRTAGRFLPSPAPGELLLAPNHNNVHLQSLNPNNDVRFQGQPNFPNHNLTMFNQVNHRNAYRPYGPQTRQMINFMNLDHLNHSHGNDDGVVVNPKPLSVYGPDGISRAQNPSLNRGLNQNLETSQLGVDRVRMNPRDEARDIPANQSSTSSGNEQKMDLGDGVTHSLPHKKYGPYICPKCKKICEVSQTFAAHMLTHYRVENKEQRKRRLAAKNKNKKNLHHIHSRGNGLTISPVGAKSKVPLKVYVRRKKAAGGKAEMATSEKVVEDKVQEGRGNTVFDEAYGLKW